MRKLFSISILILMTAIVVLSGCQKASDEMTEKRIESETGSNVEIDSSEGSVVMESEEGTIKMNTNLNDVEEGDWCPEGGEWEMTADMDTGDSSAKWTIDKIETSGDYKGLCHVIFTANGPEGDMRMDYWLDETGKNGFVEGEYNGQTIKQEFHN